MTVKELREALDKIADETPVHVLHNNDSACDISDTYALCGAVLISSLHPDPHMALLLRIE